MLKQGGEVQYTYAPIDMRARVEFYSNGYIAPYSGTLTRKDDANFRHYYDTSTNQLKLDIEQIPIDRMADDDHEPIFSYSSSTVVNPLTIGQWNHINIICLAKPTLEDYRCIFYVNGEDVSSNDNTFVNSSTGNWFAFHRFKNMNIRGAGYFDQLAAWKDSTNPNDATYFPVPPTQEEITTLYNSRSIDLNTLKIMDQETKFYHRFDLNDTPHLFFSDPSPGQNIPYICGNAGLDWVQDNNETSFHDASAGGITTDNFKYNYEIAD